MELNQFKRTKKWFEEALPKSSESDVHTQIGCHIEEFAEFLQALGHKDYADYLQLLSKRYKDSEGYAKNTCPADVLIKDMDKRVELIDALGDMFVTSNAICHTLGMDFEGAVDKINDSNFSKFEDGKALKNENGKIIKGKYYCKPILINFVQNKE